MSDYIPPVKNIVKPSKTYTIEELRVYDRNSILFVIFIAICEFFVITNYIHAFARIPMIITVLAAIILMAGRQNIVKNIK